MGNKCRGCGGDFETVKTFTVTIGDDEMHAKCFDTEVSNGF